MTVLAALPHRGDLATGSARGRSRQNDPRPETDPIVQFEALLLQGFIEAMLPNGENYFGRGFAGDVWRSLLAEKLANGLAASGQLALAPRSAIESGSAGTRPAEHRRSHHE